MVLHVFFLNYIFKVCQFMHCSLVVAKALLQKCTSCSPLFEFDEIHGTTFVWCPTSKFMNNFANKLDSLST